MLTLGLLLFGTFFLELLANYVTVIPQPSKFLQFIVSVLVKLFTTIGFYGAYLCDIISKPFRFMYEMVIDIFDLICKLLTELLPNILKFLKNIFHFFQNIFENFWNFLIEILPNILKTLKVFGHNVAKTFVNLVTPLFEIFTSPFYVLKGYCDYVYEYVQNTYANSETFMLLSTFFVVMLTIFAGVYLYGKYYKKENKTQRLPSCDNRNSDEEKKNCKKVKFCK
jgi:phage-related protein